MFSILILTRDEEANLPRCLQSVSWCDDVVVLDSQSRDRTQAVAKEGGARVFERPFDDFGAQRNHALDNIPFRYPWVFHLDADEVFNDELKEDCERVIQEDRHSAYFVPNKIIFMGRWIRRSTQYPYPQVRLLKIGEVRFQRSGHGQREGEANRGIGMITTPYEHYNFSKGIIEWVEKHNRYSSHEAEELTASRQIPVRWSKIFRGSFIERKRELKLVHARLPGRWVLKFCYLYVWKRGFLDGYPGFFYCVLQGFYDFLITAKVAEVKLTEE